MRMPRQHNFGGREVAQGAAKALVRRAPPLLSFIAFVSDLHLRGPP
mgnify:FL=1